jgi:hypothetical protein
MKFFTVFVLLTCITAVFAAEQLEPWHSAAVDEHLDVDTEEGLEELLADEQSEDDSTTTEAVSYTYSQETGVFKGKAKDGSPINVKGCSGAKAGATITLYGSLKTLATCRNNPLCQCTKGKGPAPRTKCVDSSALPSYICIELRSNRMTRPCSRYRIDWHTATGVWQGQTMVHRDTFRMTPLNTTSMCGRDGMLIHGGNCALDPSKVRSAQFSSVYLQAFAACA